MSWFVVGYKIKFRHAFKRKIPILNNGIALLRELRHSVPRKPLFPIYKNYHILELLLLLLLLLLI